MNFIGTIEQNVVEFAHIVYGIGPPTKTWVDFNRTPGMTSEEAVAIAATNPSRLRVIHEKIIRTVIEPPPIYDDFNPHPCHQ